MANKSGGEAEYHIVGIRTRVVGGGNLCYSLTDYNDIQTEVLVPIPLVAATRIEPLRLANFQSQRIRLVGRTGGLIDENFDIHRIIIFAKTVAMEYPA